MDGSPTIGCRLLAALLIAAAMAGCGKDKPTGPENRSTPFQYPALTTPESTAINVKYAWERRDSIRTKQIYADEYTGTSTDQYTVLTFTKDQEVGVVWAMAKRAQIPANGVKMDLKPGSWIRLRYPSDPAGWAAIQMTGVNIQVDDTEYGTQVANSMSFFEFKFKPTIDHTSPTDTTWQVVGWTEVKQ